MSQSSTTDSAPTPTTVDFKSIANNFVGEPWTSYPFFYTNYGNLQLDIVGFLAVLGEGSVLANSQVSTLSRLSYLPRLLPAPQALLRPSRPSKLPSEAGSVSGVHSGNKRDYVNYIGHLVLDAENMREYSVRCVQIKRMTEGSVRARTFGPQSLLAIFGCVVTLLLLALAILYRDGMAIFATCLLSLVSTVVGIGNKWRLRLHRPEKAAKDAPVGDVVIRYPKGNFLIVQCTDDVARELYFAPEGLEYKVLQPALYRVISLVGTMMIMFGVISLANAQIQLQMAFASSYIFLNAAYWIVAALPSKLHWDTSCYDIANQKFSTSSENNTHPKTLTAYNKDYTHAIWMAIVATKDLGWIKNTQATPNSEAWNQWLHIALEKARTASSYRDEDGVKVWVVPDWEPKKCLDELFSELKQAPTKEILETEDTVAGAESA